MQLFNSFHLIYEYLWGGWKKFFFLGGGCKTTLGGLMNILGGMHPPPPRKSVPVLRNQKYTRFLSRETACICLNNILIETPYCIDYKDIFFSLAQIRAYILQGVKCKGRTLETCNCIIITFAQSEKQLIFVERNGSHSLKYSYLNSYLLE